MLAIGNAGARDWEGVESGRGVLCVLFFVFAM